MKLLSFEFAVKQALESYLKTNFDSQNQHKPLHLHILVSGGKDSMALLFSVWKVVHSGLLRWTGKVHLMALHCDHSTRGDASTRDAEFVAKQCLKLGIPVQVFKTEKLKTRGAAEEVDNFQSAAAEWRKKLCTEIAIQEEKQSKRSLFLSAHHATDHLESVLMNLVRGAGAEGLMGIRCELERPPLVRPFHELGQDKILAYLKLLSLRKNLGASRHFVVPAALWTQDQSNFSTDYTRNKVRHELLPLLYGLNPNIEKAILNLSHNMQLLQNQLPQASAPQVAQALPLAGARDTLTLLRWVKIAYPDYARKVTRAQLENLLSHIKKYLQKHPVKSVKAHPKPTTFVPLRHGWRAKLSEAGLHLEFVDTKSKNSLSCQNS